METLLVVLQGPQQQNQPGGGADGTGCNFLFPYVPVCPTNPLVTMRNIVLKNIVAVDTIPLFQGPGNAPVSDLSCLARVMLLCF
jgi:hypothetical protein